MMVNGDVMVWKSPNIRRLQSLALQGFHKFVALPKGIQHLTSLQELRFWFCDSLTTIPEWIGSLNSLKLLQFRHCPKLTSLPEGLRSLTSLKLLSIAHCPVLLKRCQRTIGEDWPKIAHIEDLDFEPDPNEDNQNL